MLQQLWNVMVQVWNVTEAIICNNHSDDGTLLNQLKQEVSRTMPGLTAAIQSEVKMGLLPGQLSSNIGMCLFWWCKS
jgi:hypothetical protein